MADIASAVFGGASLLLDAWSAYRTEQELFSHSNEAYTSNDGNEILERVQKRWPPDIKDFVNLQNPFEKVLELLRNDKVKVTCIHGMVGIGKTTVMENVNDDNDVADMFDIIIWLNVSTETEGSNKSREQLQQDIVRRLNLNIEGAQDVEAVSLRIKRKLEGMNYLLLLDDVKQNLKLDEIGIPHGGMIGRKIVLTSRSRLYGPWFSAGSADTDRMIEVKLMSMPEAWKMFERVLDSPELLRNQEKKALAMALCKECLCLPVLIVIQAKTFKVYHDLFGNHNWRVWTQKDRQGIYEIFDRLKKCYDRLDDAQKKCFLYCALYPVDCEIDSDNLLKSWVAEDFISDYRDVQARDNIVGNGNNLKLANAGKILIDLKEASWLGERNKYITMHRILRQAALNFCSDGESDFMSLVSKDEVSPEDWERWSEKKYISLTYGVDHLPGNPNYSYLSTLFLQKNGRLNEIPGSFFDSMQELRVLDLSGTRITSIPRFELNMIKVLCLCNCRYLSMLPWAIGELEQLDVLDIRGTSIPADNFNNLKALKR